jgi:hypothetical protein
VELSFLCARLETVVSFRANIHMKG